MKFLIINGSPKGKYSVTLHTSLYLEKLYNEHEFGYLNVGQQIKSLEKDMSKAIDMINNSDVIIFSYPVYTFIAPSQLHRFIELLKEHKVRYMPHTSSTHTPAVIPARSVAQPMSGVTAPPPATAVIISPEMRLALSGMCCIASE